MKALAKRRADGGPILVKAGSVAVKIYQVKNRGRDLFTLTYRGPEGKLIRRQFADLSQAKVEAQLVATKIQNGQAAVLELTSNDRSIYLQALSLLHPTGERLDLAAGHYAQAWKIVGSSGSVVEAARFFAKHHPAAIPAKNIPQVYQEFLDSKVADGMSARYLEDIRSRLGRFSKHFSGHIGSLSHLEIEEWLTFLDVAAVSRNSTRAMLITFFKFAQQRGYLPKNHPTEADAVFLAKEKPSEIGIFTPEQMLRLLKHAEGNTVAYIAIGGFAGLRNAELMRLDWSDVKLDQRIIVVSAKAAKTSQRRIIPIQNNLAEWLAPFAGTSGRIFEGYGSRFLHKITSLSRACHVDWPHNGLRHSFASYRLAACKSAAEVALEMGNSPQMIFQHYRELVTPQDTETWWSIRPTAL